MKSKRQLITEWDAIRNDIVNSTVAPVETQAEQKKRIAFLEAHPEEWFRYYFPNYYYSEPANFHKQATKRFIANERWYEVRAWSRELAKSVRSMMEVLYLVYTKKARNVLLISHNLDSAVNLLTPFRLNIENNGRLMNDYGHQVTLGRWEESNFKMKNKASFTAVGAGQSPRGTREEEVRPDIIIFDDIDTDEEVRKPERIQKKWDWIEQAVIPTVSVSGNVRILFNGNIIGKDTCITRAMKQADYVSVVNIRDKNGKSTWAAKNTEKHIDWLLSKISYASAQKEYFNNPISIGTVFKEITWGRVPRIDSFKFLIKYGDPAYSNKTNKQNSQKCVVLIGKKEDKYYIFDCRLDKATNAQFVNFYKELNESYNHHSVQVYDYVENNSLQDPFFEQVLEPEFKKQGIQVRGDERKKPDKFFRVEGNLEPLNRQGKLIFNIREKDNPHMKRLEDQFLAFSEDTAKHLDGPDAVEGAVYIIDKKHVVINKEDIQLINYKKSDKRY